MLEWRGWKDRLTQRLCYLRPPLSAQMTTNRTFSRAPSIARWTRVLLVGLVLAAVLIGGGYLGVRHVLWPRIDAIRPLLLEQLTQLLGAPVEVSRLDADWGGVNPSVTIEGLSLRDPTGAVVLKVPQLSAQLSWNSLLSGEPRFNRIVLTDAQLEIERETHDLWRVAGVAFRPNEPLTFLRWVLLSLIHI